ncbi:MAG: EamA family transporter [Gammaproteobacteria bacterium]|nr:EamA family transporter [Gammaproteobacteria bacterium]
MTKNRYVIGVCVVLLGGAFLSLSGIFLRHIEYADGWSILFYRSSAFFVTMTTILAFQYRKRTLVAFKAVGRKGLYAAILLSLGNVFYIFAMLNTTVANVVFIIGSAPLITALLCWLFLKEKVTGWSMLAMVVALFGIGLMFADGLTSGGWIGSALALAMVVMYAFYLLLLRGSQSTDMVPATCLSGAITALIALPMLSGFTISQHDLVICILLGTVQFGAGFWLLTIGVRYIPAAEVALFSLSESILNPTWVFIGVGETPNDLTLYGSGIVLVSVIAYSVIAIRREKRTTLNSLL